MSRGLTPRVFIGCAAVRRCGPLSVVPRSVVAGPYQLCRGPSLRASIGCAAVLRREPLSVVPRSNAAGIYRLCRGSMPPASIGCVAVPCRRPLSVLSRFHAAGLYRLCRGPTPRASVGCAAVQCRQPLSVVPHLAPCWLVSATGQSPGNKRCSISKCNWRLELRIMFGNDYVPIFKFIKTQIECRFRVGVSHGVFGLAVRM